MIKLKAELGGEDHEISIQRSDSDIAAEIDGRKYRLELRDLGEGDYLLIDGNTIYNCHVVVVNQPGDLEVILRGCRA